MAKNSNRTILVTGATGRQGGAVLRKLRERGFPVRALTRDPSQEKARQLVGRGTEVARGDLDDPASLARALDGADGVFSVQARGDEGVAGEVRQGIQLVNSAKGSRITQFVQSSVASADERTGIPHFESKWEIEQRIRASGMRFTILRPVFFMENWFAMQSQIEHDALALPLRAETHLQMIAADDIGAFAALAFEKPGRFQDQTRELAGDELTIGEIVERFSQLLGREVHYREVPWDEWERQQGREIAAMWRWFEDVGYHVDVSQVRQEYPQLTGFDRWLGQHWVLRRTA